MAFDFKKELRGLYCPKGSPEVVAVPRARYAAVRGRGDPNEEGGDYKRSIAVLYAVSYTLRMSSKAGHSIPGFFEYVVPPLEGFWHQEGAGGVAGGDKSSLRWISVMRLPDFVTEEEISWAKDAASKKKGIDCSSAELLAVDEGLCVQMMHLGPFEDEPATIGRMEAFVAENGYEDDSSESRLHHEIYLSDPRRVQPERWRTAIRLPIRKV